MKKYLIAILFCLIVQSNPVAFGDEVVDDYIDMAASYCISGDYNSAMNYLDKVLSIYPDNKRILDLKKGLTHIIAQDKKSYISAVNPSIKQAQEYKREGNEQMEFQTLLNGTNENNAYLAYYYLGNFYRERNNFTKALDSYNNAVSSKPDFAQSYLATAITLFDMGKYNSAINPIDKYLTFNQEDDLAYAIKSRIEFQLGMIEQAKEDNQKAIELNNAPEYRFDKAKILFKLGEYQEAKDLFSSLVSDIQTSKIYEYMGYCDYELKDYMSALNNIDRALILSNNDKYLEDKYNEIKQLLERKSND